MDGPSDEALLAGMAHGDRDAAVAFVRRYQARAFGLAVAVLGDRHLAEDVTQETFVRVWRHAEMYEATRGTVRAWVATIIRNLSIDTLRLRRETPADITGVLAAIATFDDSPPDTAERRDEVGRAAQAVKALRADQQRALVLAAFYGWTAREISEAEQIPLGTAKTRIRDALLKVRAALEETAIG